MFLPTLDLCRCETRVCYTFQVDTLDGSEIARPTTGMYKNLVNNGMDYQRQLVIAGFLNHQQYVLRTGMFWWDVFWLFIDSLHHLRLEVQQEAEVKVRWEVAMLLFLGCIGIGHKGRNLTCESLTLSVYP